MEINGKYKPICTSNLVDSAVKSARRFIETGFPVIQCSGSIFGATAPATIAGAVDKNKCRAYVNDCSSAAY